MVRCVALMRVVLLLGSCSLLMACGSSATESLTVGVPTLTTVATLPPATALLESPLPSATLTRISAAAAFDTRVAQTHAAIYTRVARSPPPIHPPTPYLLPPEPTETLVFGWIGCPAAEKGGEPHYSNCWTGVITGHIVQLRAGRFGHGGLNANVQDGLLQLQILDAAQNSIAGYPYTTPQELGAVHMTSIRGTLVTLEPDVQPSPPVQFLFDFATRQWLLDPTAIPLTLPPSSVPLPPTLPPPPPTAVPTPEPSAAPSPVPSAAATP